jgi:hypothetical protein
MEANPIVCDFPDLSPTKKSALAMSSSEPHQQLGSDPAAAAGAVPLRSTIGSCSLTYEIDERKTRSTNTPSFREVARARWTNYVMVIFASMLC